MKKILVFGIVVFLLGCSKDGINSAAGLKGTWKYSGISCYCNTNSAANSADLNNITILSFATNTYSISTNNVVAKHGTYKVTRETKTGTQTIVNRIVYDGNTTDEKTYFSIENNKLTFYGDVPVAADGTAIYYERQ